MSCWRFVIFIICVIVIFLPLLLSRQFSLFCNYWMAWPTSKQVTQVTAYNGAGWHALLSSIWSETQPCIWMVSKLYACKSFSFSLHSLKTFVTHCSTTRGRLPLQILFFTALITLCSTEEQLHFLSCFFLKLSLQTAKQISNSKTLSLSFWLIEDGQLTR